MSEFAGLRATATPGSRFDRGVSAHGVRPSSTARKAPLRATEHAATVNAIPLRQVPLPRTFINSWLLARRTGASGLGSGRRAQNGLRQRILNLSVSRDWDRFLVVTPNIVLSAAA